MHSVVSGAAPVMVMSNGSQVQPNLVNGSGVPINCSSGQSIRHQLITGSSIHGQLLPVFQQQQNLPRFASQPVSAHNLGNVGSSLFEERMGTPFYLYIFEIVQCVSFN